MAKTVIILEKDGQIDVYSTLKSLCKAKNGFSYAYLGRLRLFDMEYKGYSIKKRAILRY